MPLATVLVVEDDAPIRRGLVDALRFGGYAVQEAADGHAAIDAASSRAVDLVLLDILIPKADGFAVMEALRAAKPGLPVIFLTAKGEEADRVRGLRLGADDYVVKPFSATEVLARVEAVLRRCAERPQPVRELEIAGRRIDFERREVTTAGENGQARREALSEREAAVLLYLAANGARAISREELLTRVWGVDARGLQTRAVDMTIARLREVLRDDPQHPAIILTVRNKGYMLAATGAGTAGPGATGAAAGGREP